MRRRKKKSAPSSSSARGFHHHPFQMLGKGQLSTAPPPAAAPAEPGPTRSPSGEADEDFFRREMAGVTPLAETRRRVPPLPAARPRRPIADADAEALVELSDLVSGVGAFDITNTTEFIEGSVVGLDHRLVRRLRAGEFAYQSHLDLHGMSAVAARAAVDGFLGRATQQGHRCVLLIHGRGLNSKDQIPVLKSRLCRWLARGHWAKFVLAFTSARACDGGVGALYVLLRRRQAKRPIRVTEGARW